ncbi:MAG: FxLYD domain-containing protein [Pseudomonadota bacterium]
MWHASPPPAEPEPAFEEPQEPEGSPDWDIPEMSAQANTSDGADEAVADEQFDNADFDDEAETAEPDLADWGLDEATSEDEPEANVDLLDGIDANSFASEGIRNVSDGDADHEDRMGDAGRAKEALTTIEANVASALAAANETNSIEAAAARQAKKSGLGKKGLVGKRSRHVVGALSMVAAIALLGSVVVFRYPIVKAVPDLAALYATIGLEVNLRGLAFRDIRMLREYNDGSPVFVVEGLIENVSNRTVRLPEILFSLRDDAESELYSWTTRLSLTALPAGEVTRFKTELTTTPASATDILVRFKDAPQRRAGLRGRQ